LIDNSINKIDRLNDMKEFILESRLVPSQNRTALLKRVFSFDDQDLETIQFFGMFQPSQNINSLEEQLNRMNALNFEKEIEQELIQLKKEYPSHGSIDFELFILNANDTFVISKLNGVSAFTDWNGRMCFVVLPEERVRKTLKSVITHEYHHHWRIQTLGTKEFEETLLDRIILEGLAEFFVSYRLGNTFIGPYKDVLTESAALSLWEEIFKKYADNTGSSNDKFMFGSPVENLPFWGGYSVGFHLVNRFAIHHPEITIEQMTAMKSKEFII